MIMKICGLAGAIVAAASLTSPALAENGCPSGYMPWRVPMLSPGDCVPMPDSLAPPESYDSRPAPRGSWVSTSAAVAWGYNKKGPAFVFVDLQLDEADAEEAVMGKCAKQGLENCAIAASITNGIIVVYRDENDQTSVQTGDYLDDTVSTVHQKCAREAHTCTILKIVDSSAFFM